MGVALEFSLQLGNHKPQQSDFDTVCKANNYHFNNYCVSFAFKYEGDQKVCGKVLLYHIAFIDCIENSPIETTIHSKLTEIEI